MDMANSSDNANILREKLAELPDDFADFADIYEKDLRPILEEREAERKQALSAAKQNTIIGVVIAVVAAVIGFGILKIGPVGVIGIIIGFVVAGWGYPKVHEITKQTKEFLITPVAQRFGLTYNSGASLNAESLLQKSKDLTNVT